MTDQDILDALTRILRDLLADDRHRADAWTPGATDVPDWDSFAYVNFIVAVEIELGVKFRVADVESFENVGAIVRRIKALLRPVAVLHRQAAVNDAVQFLRVHLRLPAGHGGWVLPAGQRLAHVGACAG